MVQDVAEQSGDNMSLVLLDWEKAFDKIDQERMCEALRRLNVPEKVTGHIKSLYESPRFRVVTSEDTSKYHRRSTGIRQGCPLSPYLFILLMTVMFSDIHEIINPQLYKKK